MTEIESGQFGPETGETQESDQIVYFESMTDAQKNELKEKIGQSDGLIRVWVHPFYETYLREYGFSHESEEEKKEREELPPSLYEVKANKIAEEVKKFCANPDEGPVNIVFEEYTQINETAKRIQETISQTGSKNKVYFVKTKIDDPTPGLSSRDTRDDANRWLDTLVDLDELGVKKVIVGGQLFSVVNYDTDRYHHHLPISYRSYSKQRVSQNIAQNEVFTK